MFSSSVRSARSWKTERALSVFHDLADRTEEENIEKEGEENHLNRHKRKGGIEVKKTSLRNTCFSEQKLLLAEAGVPEGGLFDLDATLPLMAVQVVLLTFLLNVLFFRPVGKVVEDREGFISTSRADAKQKLAEVERLEAALAEQLKGARQAVQSVIVDAEKEVDGLYREALAQAEAEANRTKEESRRGIEAERESARAQLKGKVDQLSTTIINRLLAA